MSIEIRPLSPENAETFAALFDELEFEHAREWKGCYCHYYNSDCPGNLWSHRTGEDNRKDSIADIRAGKMHGYLALEKGKCVGWVNADDALAYPRLKDYLAPYVGAQKIGLTICYVIEPAHRNQGLARHLLNAAIEGFRTAGYEAVIGLPVDQPMAGERRYRGTMNMYLEAGFVEHRRFDAVVVMRRNLD